MDAYFGQEKHGVHAKLFSANEQSLHRDALTGLKIVPTVTVSS